MTRILLAALVTVLTAATAHPQDLRLPILVPLTGFLSLEGTSQRNGAVLAIEDAPDLGIPVEVSDTATAPEVAVTSLLRATSNTGAIAVVAPMLGTQMLAMLPIADEVGVPLLTVSGTARITELGSPFIFRFFPGDSVVKQAHARYAVDELGVRKPAIVFQTTAYGQSGHDHLQRQLAALGAPPVVEEPLDVAVKDMLPTLSKVRDSGADALLLHLHAGPTALIIRQAAAMGLNIPIIAGSAMHQPATAALLQPRELANVCAESGSSPVSASTPELADFTQRYRDRFDAEPDAFALGQYDAVTMALAAIADGAATPGALRDALAERSHTGIAMTYQSDGTGNMAHDAVIICYNGADRVPAVVKRYSFPPAG